MNRSRAANVSRDVKRNILFVTFDFKFASVPGPAVLGGKSARLDVAGKSTLMSCK